MLGTVSNLTIDLSRLEAIWLDNKESDEYGCWGYLVVLKLKPTLQYLVNPVSGELEVHTVESPLIKQECLDQESQQGKYEHWIKLWEEYKNTKESPTYE